MLLRKIASVAVSLSLLTAPIAAMADVASDPEAQKLSDRSSPRYEIAMPGASMKAGGSMVLVNAPLPVVRKEGSQ